MKKTKGTEPEGPNPERSETSKMLEMMNAVLKTRDHREKNAVNRKRMLKYKDK
jgi:hypothetical protein